MPRSKMILHSPFTLIMLSLVLGHCMPSRDSKWVVTIVPQVQELKNQLAQYKTRTSLSEFDEELLALTDPRKLSAQEKNLLKIRNLEKGNKETLEVKPCELTEFCLGTKHLWTYLSFRVYVTPCPETSSETHLIFWWKFCHSSDWSKGFHTYLYWTLVWPGVLT